ncbi:ABC transporter permease [Corynebacterium sp. CNCTC7651]|uniref:ABC transporter permease n=1 Tax=Corynebacterium sp. CNCTC7651 TaxID=2815361 RepID=UPI001F38CC1B|nr:ABC transporter permease [Corynebacterium sp. CNCTC7651]UIZ91558.1 ABC transporter permease [Corynebacterium sp. CNCTC7651]
MNVSESLRLAASSLNTNKLRSFLTLLGIIIGIMAVIIIMTLGRGLERQTLSELEGVGTSTHYVIVHERPDEEALDEDPFAAFNYGQPTQERDAMTFDQLDQLKAYFGDRVQAVDIEAEGYGDVTYGDITASTSVYPVLTGSLGVRGLDVEYGRGITDADIAGQRPVAVVSDEFVQALFDSDPRAALGQRFDVTVSGQPAVFTVVGVLAPHNAGGMMTGVQSFSDIYIPVTSADRVGMEVPWVSSFSVQSDPTEDAATFQADLQQYLDRQYAGNDEYEAEVLDLSSALEGLSNVFRIMSSVLSAIGGISLLVGGIGVMNIMLITVTERTREIGVRKALGATQGDIRLQFIIEAMLVCLIGGVIGVLLGGAISLIATAAVFDAVTWPPLGAVVFALLFSLATGVFFGYYPASKAAKMQPIDALRYE